MPIYQFKALTRGGELQEGEIQAMDEQSALQALQARGHIPLSATSTRQATPVSRHDSLIESFTQQLMYLLDAGVNLERALEILQQHPDLTRQLPLSEILQALRGGHSFSQALADYPALFSPLYLSLVQAAEATGDLAEGLATVHRYQEHSRQLKETLSGALIYPMILALVSIASILIILLFVIPQFADILDGMRQTLPLHTQLVLDISAGLRNQGHWLALGLAASLIALSLAQRSPVLTPLLDRLRLHLPIVGPLLIEAELSRFNRSLGTLLSKGTPMLPALQIARQTLQLAPLQQLFAHCHQQLRDGQQLSPLLDSSKQIPAIMSQLVQVGEETGQLGPMLLKLADIQDRQISTRLRKLISILEPLLIISLGLIIALLVLSMLSAIIGINNISF